LLKREKRLLLVIIGDCHDNLVEQLSRSLDDIQVAVGHRIKATGVNCPSHLRKFAEECGNEKPNADRLVKSV
jgi:hypothetical protein